jgi:hypothetical protein
MTTFTVTAETFMESSRLCLEALHQDLNSIVHEDDKIRYITQILNILWQRKLQATSNIENTFIYSQIENCFEALIDIAVPSL